MLTTLLLDTVCIVASNNPSSTRHGLLEQWLFKVLTITVQLLCWLSDKGPVELCAVPPVLGHL